MIELQNRTSVHRTTRISVGIFLSAFLLFAVCATLTWAYNAPANNFPVEKEIIIASGSDVGSIAETLHAQHVIRSPLLFRVFARQLGYDTAIQAGMYVFNEPLSTYELIQALGAGEPEKSERSVTFPEGFTVRDFSHYTGTLFTEINTESLIPLEGVLFPDTYFVSTSESLDSLINRMKTQYETQLAPLRPRIEERGYSERDLIIFASILEREANDETSMRMVAGILENRLAIDMPLQVDAVFAYYLGKTSAELTEDDLRTDSPYNTYRNKGLPPAPIGNPGLMALEAVLNPTPSDYFYYLTGDDGNFYYAKTHEEHVRNKARYLR